MKILVVDDNPQNRYLLERLLESAGYRSASATNGREALELLKAQAFDGVISDVLMPGMDGFQLCRAVRQDEALRSLRFIFFTATYTDSKDAEFGRNLGADRYITKPAEPEAFLATLREVFADGPNASSLPPPEEDEDVYLEQYNARLVQKLEKKMLELEQAHGESLRANVALREEVARRQQAETSVRHSLALLQATLESTADGILALDASGRVTVQNRRFRTLWKLSEEQTLRVLDDFLPALRALVVKPEAFEKSLRELLARPYVESVDLVELKDGRIFEWVSLPQRADAPEAGRVWSFRDITERRQSEEARRKLQEQLFQSQKMEALGILAGGIAHDFNNLLTAILGQTGIVATYLDSQHPARESLDAIESAGTRAADLVRQILTFSRQNEPARKVMNLGRLVQGGLKLLRASLPPGITLQVDAPENLPPIRADATQIQQVLMNLALNASHAMKGRGTLTLELRPAADVRDLQTSGDLPPGDCLCLTVSDHGCGMSETTLRHVFEPFFTTKAPGEGTGLGLAVVHGTMKAHQGAVSVESIEGRGTTFRLYFPIVDGQAVTETPRTSQLRRGQGERILLVDDEPSVLEFFTRLLRMINYRVESFSRADQALAVFRERSGDFALAISDLSMPGMNGIELVGHLHALRPMLPVIITTGFLSADEMQRQRAAVNRELLLKPCTADQLSEVVYRVLASRKG